MSGHSPGPWSKDCHGQLRDVNGKQVDVYGMGVANLVTPSDVGIANATLMLSAPDLEREVAELREKLHDAERVRQMLNSYGVSDERMRGHISIGLDTIMTRMQREVNAECAAKEAAEQECNEQARLNGMGVERELALREKVSSTANDVMTLMSQCATERAAKEAAEQELEAFRAATSCGTAETCRTLWKPVADRATKAEQRCAELARNVTVAVSNIESGQHAMAAKNWRGAAGSVAGALVYLRAALAAASPAVGRKEGA